jgi:hypothetical protein
MSDDLDDDIFEGDDLTAGTDGLLAGLIRHAARTNEILDARIAPALERIAAALEGRTATAGASQPPPRAPGVEDLRARLDASRKANDPDSVLLLHDELAPHLEAVALAELDQDLVRWLIRLIQRRMRAGTVRVDVVELAGRVADRFGATLEGASLRASLPTLRRSAGLCPSCGEPFTGIEDACPRCLASRLAATAAGPPPADEPEGSDEGQGEDEPGPDEPPGGT